MNTGQEPKKKTISTPTYFTKPRKQKKKRRKKVSFFIIV